MFQKVLQGLRLLAVMVPAVVLAACDLSLNTLEVYYVLPKSDREEFIQRTFVEGKQINIFASGEMMLGITALYVEFDEVKELIVDEETMLRYGLGLYLARYPSTSYAAISRSSGGEISQEQFNFYRGWGMAYWDELKARPENQYLLEREELFRKRVNPTVFEMQRIQINAYLELIRDTDALNKLLTDDSFAQRWLDYALDLDRPRGVGKGPGSLGPVQTPVSPATGT